MDGITYLSSITQAPANGQKLAKIGQDKLIRLRNKYKSFILKNVNNEANSQKVSNVVEEKNDKTVKVEEKVISKPITSKETNNFNEVLESFNMNVYENNVSELPLSGARKIRTASKVLKPVKDFSSAKANGVLSIASKEELSINNEPAILEEVVNDTQVVEDKPIVNETISEKIKTETNINIPSVDDYLQKEQKEVHFDNSIGGLITQLEGDINSLKNEAVIKSEQLRQLEAKFNELQEQKKARIEELQEQKLSYTTTLEGLTAEIKRMQEAIAKEETALKGYGKAA